MRIKVPKFMRKIACKYASIAVEEETGIRNDIVIHDLIIDTKGATYRIYMSESIDINKKDLKKFIKESRKSP